MKTRASANGFTLVQVLVAAAILGILTLALLTMLNTSLKQERQLRLAKEARDFSTELRSSTRVPNCGIAQLATPMDVTDTHWLHDVVYELPQGLQGNLLKVVPGGKYGPFEILKIRITAWQNPTGAGGAYAAVDGANDTDFEHATIVRGALSVDLKAGGWNGKAIQAPVYLLLEAAKTKIVGCSADMSGINALTAAGTGMGAGSGSSAAGNGTGIGSGNSSGVSGTETTGSDFSIAPPVTTSVDSGMVTNVRTIPDPSIQPQPVPAPDEKIMQQQMKDLLDDE